VTSGATTICTRDVVLKRISRCTKRAVLQQPQLTLATDATDEKRPSRQADERATQQHREALDAMYPDMRSRSSLRIAGSSLRRQYGYSTRSGMSMG
jgi:hypothetical protein